MPPPPPPPLPSPPARKRSREDTTTTRLSPAKKPAHSSSDEIQETDVDMPLVSPPQSPGAPRIALPLLPGERVSLVDLERALEAHLDSPMPPKDADMAASLLNALAHLSPDKRAEMHQALQQYTARNPIGPSGRRNRALSATSAPSEALRNPPMLDATDAIDATDAADAADAAHHPSDRPPRQRLPTAPAAPTAAPPLAWGMPLGASRVFRARPTLVQGAPSFFFRSAPLLESRLSSAAPIPPAVRARRIVDRNVLLGDERVDLSGIGLRELSDGAVLALRRLVPALAPKLPWTGGQVSDKKHKACPSPRAKLHIFLANNRLTSLPLPISRLSTLTVLSLQNNRLEELPSGIVHMRHLVELHVGGNRLNWLPLELLHLMRKGKLRNVCVSPNPFLTPQAADSSLPTPHADYTPHWPRHSVIHSTPVTFFGPDGSRPVAPRPPCAPSPVPSSLGGCSAVALPIAPHDYSVASAIPPCEHLTRVPTLLELAVLKISELDILPEAEEHVASIYGSDDMPGHDSHPVHRLLRRARAVKNAGGKRCSVCCRSYIIPRCEWVEWRDLRHASSWEALFENDDFHFDKDDDGAGVVSLFPFLARGCSWLCVPDQAYLAKQHFQLGGLINQSHPQ
ncbi:MAG: hypothetical protein M1829_005281 [Trizodia sp. TS-e1964]|nr:MAG: hypothetical protein M1829_005281 [Trizodia sp. TS-e1964]